MHQVSYGWLGEVLRGGAVWVAVESGSGSAVSLVEHRASAALEALLAAYPVDRRPGAMFSFRLGAPAGELLAVPARKAPAGPREAGAG